MEPAPRCEGRRGHFRPSGLRLSAANAPDWPLLRQSGPERPTGFPARAAARQSRPAASGKTAFPEKSWHFAHDRTKQRHGAASPSLFQQTAKPLGLTAHHLLPDAGMEPARPAEAEAHREAPEAGPSILFLRRVLLPDGQRFLQLERRSSPAVCARKTRAKQAIRLSPPGKAGSRTEPVSAGLAERRLPPAR